MSGGVDSSVAAALLVEQGADVVGVFMRVGNHTPPDPLLPIADRHRGCCSAADAADARRVAGQLNIPFYALNFEEDFSRLIDYFADEYANARTPNPCVLCNQWLKFGKLLNYADVVSADRIATGHYARLDRVDDRPRLRRARFDRKDQSYVLFGLPPAARERTIFPIGDLSKDEVRDHARRLGLGVFDKPESQDICFVPDRDYAAVVRERRPDALRPGEIRHQDGRTLGFHDGLAQFTIGQRHGLRVAVGSPVYVTSLDPKTNTVTVGPADSVRSASFCASQVIWWTEVPDRPIRADARIRYNHTAAPAVITPLPNSRIQVDFDEPQSAITPGQAVVGYSGDTVVAGGWIDSPA